MSRRYVFKTAPRKYQVRALKKAVKVERAGLFMPMRSGKTKVAIDWAGVLHLKHGIRKVLIVTHSPTTFGVWKNEIRKHYPLPCAVFVQTIDDLTLVNGPVGKDSVMFLILNVQRVYDREREGRSWTPVKAKWLRKWGPEAIIVDESTCIGDPTAAQTRHLYLLQRDLGVRFKLILSGTPLHRKLFMAFGQFKFIDDSIFGTAWTPFKQQFGLWGGYAGRVLLKYRNLKLFRTKIEPYVYHLLRVPFRPPVEQIIPVELPEEALSLYREMNNESIVEWENRKIEAPIVLTRLLKLAQIAGGWIRDEDKQWHQVHTAMCDALRDHLAQMKSSQIKRVVIYARHIPELRDAAEAAKEAGYKVLLLHGSVDHQTREQRIARFHDPGGYFAFIAQISTGSMGIDLSSSDTTIYYTLTESLLHKDQADARIRKHGDKRALTYYYFLPRNTVLETMFLALKAKMDLVEYVMKHPDLIHHQEIG